MNAAIRNPLLLALFLLLGCGLNSAEIKDLESENIKVKNDAIYLLGENKVKSAVPVLLELYRNSRQKETRLLIIEALGEINDSSAADTLITALDENDKDIVIAAVEALGKLKSAGSVESIIDTLDREDIRLVAIWALGNIGDERAVPKLNRMLEHPDQYVKYNAAQALKRIGKK